MNDTYCYLHLRGSGRDSEALRVHLKESVLGAWRQSGITVWGIWEGLFGVGSNELIVVAAAAGDRTEDAFTDVLTEAEVLDVLLLVATVRPVGTAPCDKPGLYVFRFFDIDNANVDEIAALSNEAWTTFENTDDYAAEPQGLFAQHDRSAERGRMLLVTWYDGLNSWQTSRRPAPAAMENFLRRRALTHGTRALATRLSATF
ncbi:MAG: hypothetical protein ACC642_00580 [Pseudomonadales bacterium]